MTEVEAEMGFSHFPGIGPYRFQLLIEHFTSAAAAYTASNSELRSVIGTRLSELFCRFRERFDYAAIQDRYVSRGIMAVPYSHSHYPCQLREISDPPICLYIKGDSNILRKTVNKRIGVVGSRKPSPYGTYISRTFTANLTHSSFTIVSGLAVGIDTTAHKTCLECGGTTIAVMGCPVDEVYPSENYELAKLIEQSGVLLSEFPPSTKLQKGMFVARNRLICGLSAGIMVVEGRKHSGTLTTARYAVEQGRDVFVPPVPLNSPLSEAPLILFRQGARMVTDPQEIVEEYQ